MTDNEIIKALERCAQHTECCYCNSLEECGSKRILTTSVFDLINRQKAEIERLREIANHKCQKCVSRTIECAKSEAIKEFAERLKENIRNAIDTYYNSYGGGYYHAEDTIDDIDILVKEMTE